MGDQRPSSGDTQDKGKGSTKGQEGRRTNCTPALKTAQHTSTTAQAPPSTGGPERTDQARGQATNGSTRKEERRDAAGHTQKVHGSRNASKQV
eukprot:6492261-Amphidinium_carterae.3